VLEALTTTCQRLPPSLVRHSCPSKSFPAHARRAPAKEVGSAGKLSSRQLRPPSLVTCTASRIKPWLSSQDVTHPWRRSEKNTRSSAGQRAPTAIGSQVAPPSTLRRRTRRAGRSTAMSRSCAVITSRGVTTSMSRKSGPHVPPTGRHDEPPSSVRQSCASLGHPEPRAPAKPTWVVAKRTAVVFGGSASVRQDRPASSVRQSRAAHTIQLLFVTTCTAGPSVTQSSGAAHGA
jgi:hypothetical protein